jgi:hypothetical protein
MAARISEVPEFSGELELPAPPISRSSGAPPTAAVVEELPLASVAVAQAGPPTSAMGSVVSFEDDDYPADPVHLALDLPSGQLPNRRVSLPSISSVRSSVPPPDEELRAAPRASSVAVLRKGPELPPFVLRLLPAVALVVAALLLTILEQTYAAWAGEVLWLGPLRPAWISGPLMISGLGLLVYRIVKA